MAKLCKQLHRQTFGKSKGDLIRLHRHTNHSIVLFYKEKNASEKERSAFHLPKATTGHDENAVLFTNGTI